MNGWIRRRGLTRFMFLSLLFVTGCVIESEAPLSDPEKARLDGKIGGKWKLQTKTLYPFDQIAVEKFAAAGYPAGLMTVKMTNVRNKEATKVVLFFCTELNGKTYFNGCGQAVSAPAELPAWDGLRAQKFIIVKYMVKADTLTIWHPDESAIETAIKNGKLKGNLRKVMPGVINIGPRWELKDTTANVSQFVQLEDEKLFSIAGGVFIRAK